MNKLQKEIDSFQKVWKGGYKTGYSNKRNQAGLEIYLADKLRGKNLLEIGCGGGQWSKFILNLDIFEKIYCIDVLSEEHNEFWKYLGEDAKKVVEYIQVENFNLDFIELFHLIPKYYFLVCLLETIFTSSNQSILIIFQLLGVAF